MSKKWLIYSACGALVFTDAFSHCLLADDPVIQATPPTVTPGYNLTQPSFSNLIPTTTPTITATPPTVTPGYNLITSTNQPLVPQGTSWTLQQQY